MDKQAARIRFEQWKQIILEANKASGSKREWCQKNGINEKSFYYWQKKIRSQAISSFEETSRQTPAVVADSRVSTFVELPFTYEHQFCPETKDAALSGSPEIMIQLNGCRVFVGSNITENVLGTVIKVIRNA